eukprot:2286599-Rhodomonas_salina.1
MYRRYQCTDPHCDHGYPGIAPGYTGANSEIVGGYARLGWYTMEFLALCTRSLVHGAVMCSKSGKAPSSRPPASPPESCPSAGTASDFLCNLSVPGYPGSVTNVSKLHWIFKQHRNSYHIPTV